MTLSRPLVLFLSLLAVAQLVVIGWMLWSGRWQTALALAATAAGLIAVLAGRRHPPRLR